MQVSFVPTAGARDRIYVRRTSGSEVRGQWRALGAKGTLQVPFSI